MTTKKADESQNGREAPSVMATEEVEVSQHDLKGMFGALGILGNRFLPTMDSDIKVGRMAYMLAPAAEPLGPAKKKIMAAFGEEHDLEGLTETAASILAARMATLLDAEDQKIVKVQMPMARITKADLPKEKTGDDGWKNGAQLGAIISDLGMLFEYPDEPKE